MFRSKSERDSAAVLASLTKRHKKMLKSGEVFLAACDCFGADEPHPGPLNLGARRRAVGVDTSEEQLALEAAARFRLSSVVAALGLREEQLEHLPRSATGYLLAHTDRRLLVFDGLGKQYLVQTPMKSLWLQPVDHGYDMFTLVFTNGEDRVAVCTRRESIGLARDFIRSFPDRRGQARTVNIPEPSRIIEF